MLSLPARARLRLVVTLRRMRRSRATLSVTRPGLFARVHSSAELRVTSAEATGANPLVGKLSAATGG